MTRMNLEFNQFAQILRLMNKKTNQNTTMESPDLLFRSITPNNRNIPKQNTPVKSRSKSPKFSIKHMQGLFEEKMMQKAVHLYHIGQAILEGRALWSARVQRRMKEEQVKSMKNHLKKLEMDKYKLKKELLQISNKSQKVSECKQWHQTVFLSILFKECEY